MLHVPRNMLVEDFEHETHLKGLSLQDVWKSDPCKVPRIRCLKMRACRISDHLKNLFLLTRSPPLQADKLGHLCKLFFLLEHCCFEYLGSVVSTDAHYYWHSSANNQRLPQSGFFLNVVLSDTT